MANYRLGVMVEHSWDCGDDGLYGVGGSGIGIVVTSVLESRKRYGETKDKFTLARS